MLDSRRMHSIPARAWLLASSSAFLQVIIFPLSGPVPPWRAALCWVAMVPFLLALMGNSGSGEPLRIRDFALLGYFCGFLWYLGNCYWILSTMHLYGGLSVLASFGIMVLFCLYLGLYHALFATLVGLLRACKSLHRSVVLIAAPFLWVAVELARARVTGFPWDLLGGVQVQNSLLTALAPVGGVYALSYVIMLANVEFCSAWIFKNKKLRVQSLCVGLAMVVVLEVGGRMGLGAPPPQQGTETAVLLQPNLDVGALASPSSGAAVLQDAMNLSLHPTRTAAQTQRAVTLWPESPAPFETDDPNLREAWLLLASRTGAPVIAGTIGRDPVSTGHEIYNSAALIDPDSGYVGRYDKVHLVPFGEFVPFEQVFSFAGGLTQEVGNFNRGKSRSDFYAGGHAYGVFICYESVFGDEVREFARNGAEVFVNLSNDGWYGDTSAPFQHIAMAQMRAIENRRWVLRDTNTGITASIDPFGRIIERVPRHTQTAAIVHFDYEHETTFYTRYGDLFAYLCALITTALFAWAMVERYQLGKRSSQRSL
ncbi:apolipoprotein N-acyltransferase [Terriglobus saanensis]|uniref:Apolipoprotein N-acyltransferase n=1 Tax=Terriglobus saanensis (strain ATCC BAA-1853 / DSM 23119 / SP1PR4) TaxID=401053 RepID=E8V0V0_TERSS|nr:apolipoprotein N-acyltransferase [Terriglobus saanensis]ADV82241.1 apolipoprotein N-acyltransferase [Terriglobus saanensis SP1PR4]